MKSKLSSNEKVVFGSRKTGVATKNLNKRKAKQSKYKGQGR
jgi:hypothetical protein